jgi:hypothetical protein
MKALKITALAIALITTSMMFTSTASAATTRRTSRTTRTTRTTSVTTAATGRTNVSKSTAGVYFGDGTVIADEEVPL